jgi:hypothetical protein
MRFHGVASEERLLIIALLVVVAEGDAAVDADEEDGGGDVVVGAERPGLILVVELGLEITDEVEIDAATVVEDDGVVAKVGGVLVEVDGAGADEEVGVGVKDVEDVDHALEADEVGALFGGVAAVEVDAGFEGGCDGQAMEVAGEVDAEGRAVIATAGVGGIGIFVASEDGDGFALVSGGDVLRVGACDGQREEESCEKEAVA